MRRQGIYKSVLTLDVAFFIDGPERGHERRALRRDGRVRVLGGKRWVVREQFMLDRLQLCEVLFFIGGGRCGVLDEKKQLGVIYSANAQELFKRKEKRNARFCGR